MLRTFALAAIASLALGSAATVPTTASAHGWRHHHHHHHGWRHRHYHGPRFVYRAPVYAGYNPCLRRRWVPTPWGPQLRVVNVCY
jgi:hypothetical protein